MTLSSFLYWCLIGFLLFVVWVNVRKGYRKTLEPEEPPVPPTLTKHPVLGSIYSDGARWWGRLASGSLGYEIPLSGLGPDPAEDQVKFWLLLEERLPEILRTCPPFPEERCSSYGNSPVDFRPMNSKIECIQLMAGTRGLVAEIALERTGVDDFYMSPYLRVDSEGRITDLDWSP